MKLPELLATIQHDPLRAVVAHWAEVRKGRLMPAWQDIDATAIGKHLHLVWAWKYDFARETFIGRLAGEEITTVLGREIRGRPLEECFPPSAAPVVLERYRSIMTVPQIMHSIGNVHMKTGRHGVGERIVLPLATDGKTGDGILGATVYRLDFGAARSLGASIDHLHEAIEYYPLK
jgi:hypothetical protein